MWQDPPGAIVFSDELKNTYPAEDVKGLIRSGSLRKLARGAFTTERHKPLDVIVRENWWRLAERWFPGGLVVRRSAVPGVIEREKVVYLTFGRMHGTTQIHGFRFTVSPGRPAVKGVKNMVCDHRLGKLFVSSRVRAMLENLEFDIDQPESILGYGWVEDELRRLYRHQGYAGLVALCMDAGALASHFGMEKPRDELAICVERVLALSGNGRGPLPNVAVIRGAVT
jgi:hypothetical protein